MPELTINISPGMAEVAKFLAELTQLVRVIIESQPVEVREQTWQWYVEDMKAWRKFWGLPV